MNSNSTDREQLLLKVRNTPKQVFWAVYLSVLLGLLLAVRATVLQVTTGTISGKSLLFTALTVGFFVFNGFSLLGKSRFSYVLLVAFSLLPLPGFAGRRRTPTSPAGDGRDCQPSGRHYCFSRGSTPTTCDRRTLCQPLIENVSFLCLEWA